jgi:hypothetical protein
VVCGGFSSRLKAMFLDDLQMEEGKLSVLYLGVPLVSSKLSAMDCRVLIEKIKAGLGLGLLGSFSL